MELATMLLVNRIRGNMLIICLVLCVCACFLVVRKREGNEMIHNVLINCLYLHMLKQ